MWAGLVLWTSYSTSMCLYHPFDIMYRISLAFYWCVLVCASHFTHKKRQKTFFFYTSRFSFSSAWFLFSSTLIGLFQLEEDRPHPHHSFPRPAHLRRLASYVFSSATMDTEHFPHDPALGAAAIQRSRSAESSPAHRHAHRRHMPLLQGNPRARHSVLNLPRLHIQQMLAKLMNKTWFPQHQSTQCTRVVLIEEEHSAHFCAHRWKKNPYGSLGNKLGLWFWDLSVCVRECGYKWDMRRSLATLKCFGGYFKLKG